MFSLVVLAAVITIGVSQDCQYGDSVCICNENSKTCSFTLVIEHLQTFTKYQLTNSMRGTGQLFYINGSLMPTKEEETGPCVETSDSCTDAHTVDGKTFRSFIAVNGLIPGPTLIVHMNQIVVVKVMNKLASESTSIHWHGMHQRNTPWMDGVGQITQCPILPGTNFTYIFSATPSGTFWYHSHTGAQ